MVLFVRSEKFNLNIPKERILSYYSGHTRYIRVKSDSGLWVQFPASLIRPFVTEVGVHGYFEIIFRSDGKLETFRCLQTR